MGHEDDCHYVVKLEMIQQEVLVQKANGRNITKKEKKKRTDWKTKEYAILWFRRLTHPARE